MSRRFRRSNTRASMGDSADSAAGLSKVGLRARSAPATVTAAVTARKIANRDKRIWIAEIIYRCNPLVAEKFWFAGGLYRRRAGGRLAKRTQLPGFPFRDSQLRR